MKFALTKISQNRKLGPIPSVIATNDTCPSDCTLRGQGCYAEAGPLAIQWRRVENHGLEFDDFLKVLKQLPRRQIWRYGTAGDLPPQREQLMALAAANQNRPVIAYTHGKDIEAYREATARGFHINLSADNLEEVDKLAETGLSVVTILPSDNGRRADEGVSEYRTRMGGSIKVFTPKGRTIIPCPATYIDTTCSSCQICSGPRKGGVIVGFPAHGSRKKLIDERLSNGLTSRPNQTGKRSIAAFEPRIAA